MPDDDSSKLPFFLSEKDICAWTGRWHSCRRVLLTGGLNVESLKRTSLELVKLDYAGNEPITIMINTEGGDVVATHQFEDLMSMLNSPIDALVIGDCASMGVDLVQMCRRRMILPSARMLVHYIRNTQPWICDDLGQLETDIGHFRERMKNTASRRLDLYVKRTGLSQEKISELFRHGEVHRAYFSAKQAVEMHLVDEIATDFKLFPIKNEEKK